MSHEKHHLSWDVCRAKAAELASRIQREHSSRELRAYAVPRGGIPAALLIAAQLARQGITLELVDNDRCDFFIDDLIDSGRTMDAMLSGRDLTEGEFYVLFDKREERKRTGDAPWYVFPWETGQDLGPQENIRRLLEYIGEDPNREGLKETPHRVVRSYDELFGGYSVDEEFGIAELLKTFPGEDYDEMVLLKDCEFFSTCEHHMLTFAGKAHVAYIPNGKIVGISKLARLVEVYSRRLQVQERICKQVVNALMIHLKAKGAACILEAQHGCMTCRGVEKQHSIMVTSALEGVFRDGTVRQELFSLIRG